MSAKVTALLWILLLAPILVWGTWKLSFYPSLKGSSLGSGPLLQNEAQISEELLYKVKPGFRYVYAFERRLLVQGWSSIPEITYEGNFYLDVLKSKENSSEILIRADLYSGDGIPQEALRTVFDSRFQSLALFQANSLSIDPQQRNLLRDLFSLWAFPLTQDAVNEYAAKIQYDQEKHWTKTKLHYLATPAPTIIFSENKLSMEDFIPLEISGREETRLGDGGANSITSKTSYRMRLLRVEALRGEISPGEWKQTTKLSLEITPPQKYSLKELQNIWENSLALLTHWDQLSQGERLHLFGEWVKLLKNDSQFIRKLQGLLSNKDFSSNSLLFRFAVGALATVGGDNAERSLIELYAATSASGKGTVLAALASTEAVLGDRIKRFLLQEMQQHEGTDLGYGAAFAFGSALHGQEATASEVGTVLEGWEKAEIANDERAKLDWIDVMGNSGSKEFAGFLLEKASANGSPTLQARAVFALRFVDSDPARNSLVEHLTSVQEISREAAARAIQLATWNIVFLPALQDCKTSEKVSSIQEICSTTLAQHTEHLSAK